MEHWITAKRDELISTEVQDAITPSSPAPPAAQNPGTRSAGMSDPSVLCSRDSEDEDVEQTPVQAPVQQPAVTSVKTPVGVGAPRAKADRADDGTEYFI